MSDLISKSALLEDIERSSFNRIIKEVFEYFVDDHPTVEARPVVHGEWLDSGEVDKHGVSVPFAIKCSICGSFAGASWMKFCPNCGSYMKGKVEHGKID